MRCTSLAAPYLGDEIKVQTMVPLWAERHREGGGVVVSLQDVRHWQRRRGGAHRLPQTVPFAPAQQMLGGHPALPIGSLGGPISLALRGAQQ